MKKLYLLPVLVTVLVSYRTPSVLAHSPTMIGASILLYKGNRRLVTERSAALVAGSFFSVYTAVASLVAVATNKDGVSLKRAARGSFSVRYALLSLASLCMFVSNPGASSVPLVVWSLMSIFLRSERVVSVFWIPQITSSLLYEHFADGLSFAAVLSGVLAILLATPLRFVKKRDIKKK